MGELLSAMQTYANRKPARFHMPGHKGNLSCANGLPYDLDVTEVYGVDKLRHPTGVLKHLEERLAGAFGSRRAFLSVNGSTGALYAGIYAACRRGDTILVSRNCHLSVWQAAEFMGLQTVTIEPEWWATLGVFGAIPTEAVRFAVKHHPEARLCVLPSPTYEGFVSDTAAIAEILHGAGIPLLLDAAHGREIPPQADMAAQSLHKVFAAMTQTAALHWNSALVTACAAERAARMFTSTSPSYILMTSAENALEALAEDGAALHHLAAFRQAAADWKNLRLVPTDDPYKLLINLSGSALTAAQAEHILREQYNVEAEYCKGRLLLCMVSDWNTAEDFARLKAALAALDAAQAAPPGPPLHPPPRPEQRIPIAEAVRIESEEIPLQEAEGRVAWEYLYAYPPGVPLCFPGCRIAAGHIAYLDRETVRVAAGF
ncbi:MAG: DegT/DnrJ/EryC1/StrS family aminotransferase [Oscillospiraceae bacterium]|jgi:arginine/lysine/ornithine decarboxylase|nr:DegT/DnrJ/EryC1/StrS family aminotransferase [Oscillospiraceae bacterium]